MQQNLASLYTICKFKIITCFKIFKISNLSSNNHYLTESNIYMEMYFSPIKYILYHINTKEHNPYNEHFYKYFLICLLLFCCIRERTRICVEAEQTLCH